MCASARRERECPKCERGVQHFGGCLRGEERGLNKAKCTSVKGHHHKHNIAFWGVSERRDGGVK